MRVLVQTALGTSFELVTSPEDNVYLLKCKIMRKLGIPVAQQHLMHNLVELTNSANLSSYSIKDGSVLKLLVSLKNGLIADCGRTISTLDHIQWTELKEEAMELLHAGYKGLVIDDDDDDFIAHFLIDTPQSIFLPGIPLTEEDCVTKCKMIDVQSRMRELTLKRFEKNYQSPFEGSSISKEYLRSDCPCGEGNHVDSILSGVRNIYREPNKRYSSYKSSIRKLPNINSSFKDNSSKFCNHCDGTICEKCKPNLRMTRENGLKEINTIVTLKNSELSSYKESRDLQQKVSFLPPIDKKMKDKGKRHIGGKSERTRCLVCKKRLSIATVHNCQCGGAFCAPHRYSEVHNCKYDYSKEWLSQLQKANPPAYSFPKLPRI